MAASWLRRIGNHWTFRLNRRGCISRDARSGVAVSDIQMRGVDSHQTPDGAGIEAESAALCDALRLHRVTPLLQVHGGTAWSLGVCTGQLAGFRGRSAVTSILKCRAGQSQSRRATGTRTGRTHTRRAFASSPNAVAVALSLCLAVLASPSWPCRLGPAVLAPPSWPCRLGLAVSVPSSWSCLAWLVCHCRLRLCHRLCLSRRGRRPRRTKRPRAAAAATGRSWTPPVVFRLLLPSLEST